MMAVLNILIIKLNYWKTKLQMEIMEFNKWSNTVLLKYLSNFWRPPKMPLINFKIELKLKWKF